jgi:hypothetical protein
MSVNKSVHTDTEVSNVKHAIAMTLYTALSLDGDFTLSGNPPIRYKNRGTLKRRSCRLLLYDVCVFASCLQRPMLHL